MLFVYLLYAYLLTGFVVGAWFCFFRAGKVDPATAHSGLGFKLIILPAAILLWPILLGKQIKKEK